MSLFLSIAFLIVLLGLELVYFKIADRFDIIDKPNERSSHSAITLRGGGVIFPMAAILFFTYFQFQYPFFLLGLVSIAVISFLDDVHTLNNKVRLSIHLLSVALLFYQWDLFSMPWYWLVLAAIFVIGTINAYNFMDGINGITGSYSLLVIITLYYINENIAPFISSDFLIVIGLSLLVFNFFNFRNRAKCFAGDVGSVSIAFIVVFLIGRLILETKDLSYILLILLYGLDTVVTIGFRLIRRENIFKAHRTHFYQFLANEREMSHLNVSLIYFVIQMLINLIVIISILGRFSFVSIALLVVSSVLFFWFRFRLEGRERLLGEEDRFFKIF